MARPIKDGLSYFPFDVDFFSDIKIKSLRARFGADGITLYLYILCEIYRNGYYIKADEDFIDCASADLGLTVDKTRQLMKFFCKRSLFDDTLFTADTILTAKSVQRRYQEARKGSKRDIFVDNKSWLLEENETLGFIKVRPVSDSSEKNAGFSKKNSDKSENYSTKEKESKEKESKGKQCVSALPNAAAPASTTREELVKKYGSRAVEEYEKRFRNWQAKTGRTGGNMYAAISRWMFEDNVQPDVGNHSFDVDDVVARIRGKRTNDEH